MAFGDARHRWNMGEKETSRFGDAGYLFSAAGKGLSKIKVKPKKGEPEAPAVADEEKLPEPQQGQLTAGNRDMLALPAGTRAELGKKRTFQAGVLSGNQFARPYEEPTSRNRKSTDRAMHYKNLGLQVGASLNDVHVAYRALAKKYHPDTSGLKGGANAAGAEKFARVNLSYRALKNEFRNL